MSNEEHIVTNEVQTEEDNAPKEKKTCFWSKMKLGAKIAIIAGAAALLIGSVVLVILLAGPSGLSSDTLYCYR